MGVEGLIGVFCCIGFLFSAGEIIGVSTSLFLGGGGLFLGLWSSNFVILLLRVARVSLLSILWWGNTPQRRAYPGSSIFLFLGGGRGVGSFSAARLSLLIVFW